MRTRTTAAALAAAALLTLTACGNTGTTTGSTTDDKPAAAKDTSEDAGKADTETASLPDMAGKGLQSAQNQAQKAGFYGLTSHDALGRGRMQAFDRNWKVCSQAPKAGEHPTDAKVDFATVKLEETCPAKDAGAEPAKAGSKMPDFKGKSVKAAREASTAAPASPSTTPPARTASSSWSPTGRSAPRSPPPAPHSTASPSPSPPPSTASPAEQATATPPVT